MIGLRILSGCSVMNNIKDNAVSILRSILDAQKGVENNTFGRSSRPLSLWHGREWGLASLLILFCFITYSPIWNGGFILDDDVLITSNQATHASNGLWIIWTNKDYADYDYFPMTSTLFWLEWRLWATHALGYHLVNVLIHGLAAVVMWRVGLALNIVRPWLVAMIFAIHPVGAESVAWISEGKNTLSLLFYLVALLLYLKYDNNGRMSYYFLAIIMYVMGLLSKTSIITLPLILLLFAWWRKQNLFLIDLVRAVPFFILSLIFGVITIRFQHPDLTNYISFNSDASWMVRLGLVGHVVWFYVVKAFWPFSLMMLYPQWELKSYELSWYFLTLLFVLLFGILWCQRRSWGRVPFFGLTYFLIMLLPTLGFFNMSWMKYSFVADHFEYLALPGMIGLAVAGGEAIINRFGSYTFLIRPMVWVPILAFGGWQTWRQSVIDGDKETLWRANLEKNATCWGAEDALGIALCEKGKIDEAIPHIQKALKINPNISELHNNLGFALFKKGEVAAAITHLKKAITLNPNDGRLYINYGLTLLQNGQMKEAITEFKKGLEMNPNYAEGYNCLGDVLFQEGQLDKAIFLYQKALEIDPDIADAHNNLGNILVQQGQMEDAALQFKKVLEIDPKSAEAYYSLGNIFAAGGQMDKAISQYNTALKINPRHVQAHYNLGVALYKQEKLDEAMVQFKKTVELDANHAQAHNSWGAILLRTGHIDEAVAQFQAAVKLKPDYSDASNNLDRIAEINKLSKISTNNASQAQVWYNLGVAYFQNGQVDEAIVQYQKAIKSNPKYAQAHNGLGAAFSQKGQVDKAIIEYKKAIEFFPKCAESHNNLGNSLSKMGQVNDAVSQYRQALEIEPNYAEAHYNLGDSLLQMGKITDALAQFQQALKLKPSFNDARNNLSAVQEMMRLGVIVKQ